MLSPRHISLPIQNYNKKLNTNTVNLRIMEKNKETREWGREKRVGTKEMLSWNIFFLVSKVENVNIGYRYQSALKKLPFEFL